MINIEYFGYGAGLVILSWTCGMIVGALMNLFRKF